ncbi:MAG: hypothetical protein RIS43_777, partial [Actinomycetota bacterium]
MWQILHCRPLPGHFNHLATIENISSSFTKGFWIRSEFARGVWQQLRIHDEHRVSNRKSRLFSNRVERDHINIERIDSPHVKSGITRKILALCRPHQVEVHDLFARG